MRDEPNPSNQFHAAHINLLLGSYRRWTGRRLEISRTGDQEGSESGAIYRAPFVVLSHGTEADPIFNYANQAGQSLFEMTWREFMETPSRLSAEPLVRAERLRLFERVAEHGFIEDYRGVRVSKSGRRFFIERATVWTVQDAAGNPAGQAALFSHWEYL